MIIWGRFCLEAPQAFSLAFKGEYRTFRKEEVWFPGEGMSLGQEGRLGRSACPLLTPGEANSSSQASTHLGHRSVWRLREGGMSKRLKVGVDEASRESVAQGNQLDGPVLYWDLEYFLTSAWI